MPPKRSKKYIKTQFDALDELQVESDSVEERFEEIKSERVALRKDIKLHRGLITAAGAEDQLREWDEKRSSATNTQSSSDAPRDPDAANQPE